MNNLTWSGEVSQGWFTLTHLKTSESMTISVGNINNLTEEILQSKFNDMLSDRDIMLAFKVLFDCVRNK